MSNACARRTHSALHRANRCDGPFCPRRELVLRTLARARASSIVVILVWVCYSAQIFLAGAEFTWVYAHRYGSRCADRKAPGGPVAGTAIESPPDRRITPVTSIGARPLRPS